jgi:hypothetical protein
VGHHLDHVRQDGGLVVVQLDKLAVALEDRVIRPVRCPPEPPGRRRARAAGDRRLEGGELPADMVEHAVEYHPQAPLPGRGHQGVEVVVVAEPRVDPEVIGGVVPVRLGGEDRAEQQPVAAELDRVVKPRFQVPQPVPDRLARGQRRRLRAGEAERVHLPQDGVISPGRHPLTLPAPPGQRPDSGRRRG